MITRKATIVTDFGFGDAGKGSIVDYFARTHSVSAVVRFNGGGQAAHNVVTPDGRHHAFSQFGSGTFVPGVRTHLSRFMLVDPDTLADEAMRLDAVGCGNVFTRFSVDEGARIVTPFQKAANRLREFHRGDGRHGTVGMGIGETMADCIAHPELTIYARELRDPTTLSSKLRVIQEMKRDELKEIITSVSALPEQGGLSDEIFILEDTAVPDIATERMWRTAMRFTIVPGSFLKRLAAEGDLVFEGAQGVLLDEWYGFHPHTTWSTTTFANAQTLLQEIGYEHEVERVGVLRAYFTRHGQGPFPTEDARLTADMPDMHNDDAGWQGKFRSGWFDMVLARYALEVSGGADSLAITNIDRLRTVSSRFVCSAYKYHLSRGKIFERLVPKSLLTDLSYQETLRCLLEKVTPLYEMAPSNDAQYVEMLEGGLGIPVTITSHGPTALDKRTRARVMSIAA